MVDDGVTPDFQRLVEALRPFLPDVVVVGGWAHRLFARHPLAVPVDFQPLTTDDADIALPRRLPARAINLGDRLKEAGFNAEMKGEDRPPVTHYRLGEGEFYVEFLAPKTGDGHRRSGGRDATARVQGVVAQKLPHIDLLLASPWSVTMSVAPASGQDPVNLLIPNPAAYLAQKLLVLPDRTKEKQANDIVYIHDTLMMFAESLPALASVWVSMKPQLTKKQIRNTARAIRRSLARLTTGFGRRPSSPRGPVVALRRQPSRFGIAVSRGCTRSLVVGLGRVGESTWRTASFRRTRRADRGGASAPPVIGLRLSVVPPRSPLRSSRWG